MDLYLPADFHSLRDEIDHCAAHSCDESDDYQWLGGEAYVASSLFGDRPAQPLRCVARLHRLPVAEPDWISL